MKIFSQITLHVLSTPQVIYFSSNQANFRKASLLYYKSRNVTLTAAKNSEKNAETLPVLGKADAIELVLCLNEEERKDLQSALQDYQAYQIKKGYEEKLACRRWRSIIGKPNRLLNPGDMIGTTYPVPKKWLIRMHAGDTQKPTTTQLLHLSLTNAIPFFGFGFLDNAIMIIAGESIETTIKIYLTISTMAAAALGNTISDIAGLCSASYVERAASNLGFTQNKLSPVQIDMSISRTFANLGRVAGITVGCLLGMFPLLFL